MRGEEERNRGREREREEGARREGEGVSGRQRGKEREGEGERETLRKIGCPWIPMWKAWKLDLFCFLISVEELALGEECV